MNPLEKELKTLIKKDDAIFNFIEENALDGIFFWDLANRANGWHNTKFWEILGYTMQEVNKGLIKLEDIINEDDFILANKNYEAHIKNPEKYPFVHDVRHTQKNGATVWLRVRGTIIYNADKQPYRMLGTHTCITKQKEAELELNKKIQHYENVISGANMGSWECNLITAEAKYNERWAEIFGYTLKELAPITPTKWMSFIHPEDIESANSAFESHIKGEVFAECEFRMKHKQGHWVWVLSRGKVMLEDLNGKPQIIAGSHYDITERKTNEILANHYKDLLERTNEVAKIGSWELDLTTNTLNWSAVTKHIHEVPDNFTPNLEGAINFYPEGSNRELIETSVAHAINDGKNYDIELQIQTAKGTIKWVRAIGIPLIKDGECYKIFGLFQDIDTNRRNQINVELSEKKFRNTFDYAGAGIAIIDSALKLEQANASFCTIFGYTEKELKDMDLATLSYPEDKLLFKDKAAEIISGKLDSFNAEKRYLHKTGKVLWISVSLSSIKDENNNNIQYVIQVQDITTLKTNETLLSRYKDLLEQTNEVAKMGSWEIDLINSTATWSKVTKQIYEVSNDYLPNLEKALAFYPEGKYRDLIQNALNTAITEGKNYDIEIQILTANKTFKWVRAVGIPEFKNKVCIRVYGLFQDIDKAKRTAEELAIKEEEQRLTFNHATIGLATLGADGKGKKANKSFCDILGRTEAEVLTLSFQDITHPDDIDQTAAYFTELMEGVRDEYRMEKRYLHKNGYYIWVDLSLTKVKNDDDELAHFLVQLKDITQRKKTELLLQKNVDLLSRINEAAQIGVWEVNLDIDTVYWSNTIKKLMGVPLDYEPTLEDAYSFFVEGEHRDRVIKAVEDGIETGAGFDLDLMVKNKITGRQFWNRTIGISEFSNGECKRLYGFFQDIDEAKRTADNLTIKEEEQRLTFDNASIGLAIIDPNDVMIKANKSYCDILGRTEEELIPLTAKDITHPDDLEKTNLLFSEMLNRERDEYKIDKRYFHKKGHIIWANITVTAVKNEQGKLMHFLLQLKDITQRKETELLLQKNVDLLSRINEAAQIGVWEVNLDNDTVYWSDTIKHLMGVPLDYEPTLEDAYSFFIEGEHRDRLVKGIENGIETGAGFDLELMVKNKITGRQLWTRTIGISEFSNGQCTRLYGFFQDIDEKTRIAHDLATKEEEFRQTFTYATIGMAVIDADRTLRKANQSLCDILGYTEAELQRMSFADFIHPEDLELSRNPLINLINSEQQSYKIEHRCIHKKGHLIWVNASFSTVKNDSNKFIHIVAQIQDITESKNNQLLLERYKSELEHSNTLAKIGSWEIDVKNNNAVVWSDTLKQIIDAPPDIKPTVEDAINLYPEGIHRDTIEQGLEKALSQGENFDVTIQINTYNKQLKWVRAIGIADFQHGECQRIYGLFQDIDEIKKAQAEITLKEEEFRQTFTLASIGLVVINKNGRITQANQGFCNLLGYSEKEICNRTFVDITYPEDIPTTKKLHTELLKRKRKGYNLEKRYLHKNGQTVWVSVTLSSINNDAGELIHYLKQVQDITGIKKNQLLLEKYKKELEHSNRMAKIGSWEIDVQNKNAVFWSDTLKDILEAPTNVSPTLEDAINLYPVGPHRDSINQCIDRAIFHGENFDVTIQIKTYSNQLKWVRAIGIPEYQKGKCQRIYGLFQDVNEAKQAETEIALKEEQFRQTFWHANIGMTLLDLNGKITRANPSVCNTFGYPEEEFIKMPFSELTHPDDLELSHQLVLELAEGKRNSFQIEKRGIHKNGDVIWILLSTSSVKNDHGEVSHFVSQIQDITENKKLTESLKEHNNRLLNFAHIVSHNLRSHTGNITMLLNINEANNTNIIDNELYQHIKSASNNMNETVNYLTEIVEINSQVKNNLVPKNLSKSINKALQNVQSSISLHDIEVQVKVDKSIEVIVVPAYLDSIVFNLITNAIKYRSPDRICKINISTSIARKFIHLQITDNGQGIDLEKHGDKLFGMYKTFHDHEDARGIGLFISKNQIEAMDGKIEVISKVDKGSTFKTYFKYEHNN